MIGRAITGVFSPSSPLVGTHQHCTSEGPISDSQISRATEGGVPCETASRLFVDCMSRNGDDLSMCQAYYEMMRKCQGTMASF